MKFVVYKSADGWRWKFVSRNGRSMACSGEAYYSKSKALRAIYTIREYAGTCAIEVRK